MEPSNTAVPSALYKFRIRRYRRIKKKAKYLRQDEKDNIFKKG